MRKCVRDGIAADRGVSGNGAGERRRILFPALENGPIRRQVDRPPVHRLTYEFARVLFAGPERPGETLESLTAAVLRPTLRFRRSVPPFARNPPLYKSYGNVERGALASAREVGAWFS